MRIPTSRVRDHFGMPLPYDVTYGEVYENDLVKKRHIETHFPKAKYIVIRPEDLKNGDLTIEQLSRPVKDRLSPTVLYERADRKIL